MERGSPHRRSSRQSTLSNSPLNVLQIHTGSFSAHNTPPLHCQSSQMCRVDSYSGYRLTLSSAPATITSAYAYAMSYGYYPSHPCGGFLSKEAEKSSGTSASNKLWKLTAADVGTDTLWHAPFAARCAPRRLMPSSSSTTTSTWQSAQTPNRRREARRPRLHPPISTLPCPLT